MLNVSKFVLGLGEPGDEVTEPLDLSMLANLDAVVRQATDALRNFEHTAALEAAERFFWFFCDDYVELVKQRAYGGSVSDAAAGSTRLALRTALSVLLRLLAPYVPYATEEAWSWWHDDSVHTSPWPRPAGSADGDGSLVTVASSVIRAIRKAKTDAKQSMRAPVQQVRVFGPGSELDAVAVIGADLRAAGNVDSLLLEPAADPELRVEVSLAAG